MTDPRLDEALRELATAIRGATDLQALKRAAENEHHSRLTQRGAGVPAAEAWKFLDHDDDAGMGPEVRNELRAALERFVPTDPEAARLLDLLNK